MSTILDQKLSTIVSNSYGYVGEAVSPNALMGMQNLHLQAAGEGVGLYFSSGDNGDEKASLGYTSPDFPASSPFVTAVGGTSLAVGREQRLPLRNRLGNHPQPDRPEPRRQPQLRRRPCRVRSASAPAAE